ncbi:OmpP1/FadL family transporter [Azospirillum canadense]|uniref:OmpP1/FadL family transporter n=1 Tax=Azospirillum canadense TaxID=403962 RepID=UPI002225FEA9|nr:outer membrane protein transport protein [Azospirillum canadense]MCW2236514.1 long-chain fatty acid transport protein [Azospirillum canadense]
MPKNDLKAYLLAAVAVAAVSAPLPTLASGYLLKEQSASGQGTSFAGVTANAAGDATALFFNPAALGAVNGNEAVGVVSGIFPSVKTSNAVGTRAARLGGGRISGTSDSDDLAIDAALPSGYVAYTVSPDVKLGLSINSPWGLSTDYPENWVGRYHGVHSSLLTLNITPTVAYKLLPELTVAGGIQFQYAKARLSQAVDFGSILAATGAAVLPGSRDGMGEVKGSDWGFGATAGLLYEPAKGTRFGLSYRSSVSHELEGDAKFEGVPAVPALRASFANTFVKAKVTTPDIIGFGAYHEITSDFAVMADVQWTNWSRFKELRIRYSNPLRTDSVTEEQWDDAWFFALGAAYKVNEKLTLRAGVAYDQTPVQDQYRTPRIPDGDRYWLSVGAGYQLTDNIRTDIGYTHVFANTTKVNLTDNLTGTDAFRGNLSADYKASVDIVALQTKISF